MSEKLTIIYYTEISAPLGPLTVAATDKGICWIEFGGLKETLFTLQRWAKKWVKTDNLIEAKEGVKYLDNLRLQLEEYFLNQRKEFDIEIDLYGTPFQKLVWDKLLEVPYGHVNTYKDIAIKINSPKSVRAIGGANHNNPIPIVIPCHRIVGSNGNLVGYRGGTDIKQYLLNLEGYYEHKQAK